MPGSSSEARSGEPAVKYGPSVDEGVRVAGAVQFTAGGEVDAAVGSAAARVETSTFVCVLAEVGESGAGRVETTGVVVPVWLAQPVKMSAAMRRRMNGMNEELFA